MFASVFDNGGVAMLVMRPDGAIEKANPVMRGLLGNDGGALEANCLEEIVHPDDWPALSRECEKLLSGDPTGLRVGNRYIDAKGAIISAFTNITPVRAEIGEVVSFIVQLQNVHIEPQGANNKTKVEPGDSEEQFRDILYESPISAIIVTRALEPGQRTGKRLLLNRAAVRDFETGDEERLKGSNISSSWVNFEQMLKFERLVRLDKGVNGFEGLRRRPDGTTWWASLYSRPIWFGGQACDINWHINITDRKYAEQEATRLQKELLRKERFATLGELSATVSHELRNPLASVRASLYALRKKFDPNDAVMKRAIERAERGVGHCDRIIDHLLDFTRVSRSDRDPVNMRSWLNELFDEQVIPEAVMLVNDLDDTDVVLTIDSEQFRRAVINVFENSFQALTENIKDSDVREQGTLTISLRVSDNRFEIIISDNGPGINENITEQIFDPLFSTKTYGTGLGLSIVQGIMEQHDGGIEVRSIEGEGATFMLWLPKDP